MTSAQFAGAQGPCGSGGTSFVSASGTTYACNGSFALPFSASTSTPGTAFQIENTGTGSAGLFRTTNAGISSTALIASTTNGDAFAAATSGSGAAGIFQINNANNTNFAVRATTTGSGSAILGHATGSGGAGNFSITNAANSSIALLSTTNGSGAAIEGRTFGSGTAIVGSTSGTGRAGVFLIDNPSSAAPTVSASTNGRAAALLATSAGNGEVARFIVTGSASSAPVLVLNTAGTGNLAIFQKGAMNLARIDNTGKGFFNGGTQAGGADLAEAFAVAGDRSAYEPGDVLVIATEADRRMSKSSEPYSSLVAGVYATKPGVLLTDRMGDEDLSDLVPMGVVGVIPTKVTLEGGPIRRGDLLVTSSTPGAAMRADPTRVRVGQVLGKALQPFERPGTGRIQVLVNVQ